ncbi:MAG: alanine racemase, partial [Alphaproteobacteria bacterium]|nr:alanine racemase [Alphaproteobacteria bacterium]
MSILTRPILEIDLNNLLANYKLLASIATNATPSAVVKDESYGIGADVVVPLLYKEANCRNFFVAHAIEAKKIS